MKKESFSRILNSLMILSILIFTSSCKKDKTPASITDIEGNVYKIVTIGTQTWMAENLKTTKLTDGTSITVVTDNTPWLNSASASICYPYNDNGNKAIYGVLYNWFAVNTGKLCPDGWHVATDADWTTLVTYAGGTDIAGGKLKETGTSHWNDPNTGAADEFGFRALPGGMRYNSGTFSNTGSLCVWWSSTEDGNLNAWSCSVVSGASVANRYSFAKQYGLSVRCVKN